MNTLLMVHGYNHDPKTKDGEHSPYREGGNFDLWPKIFTDHECEPMPWYSAIQFKDTLAAFKKGHPTTYRWSYCDLAPAACNGLMLQVGHREGLDVVAHSLGSRVALLAVMTRPQMFRKVLLLNGAEIWREAIPVIEDNPQIEFLNVAVREDDVLARMGAKAAPGEGVKRCIGNGCPPGMRWLPNFSEVILDDKYDQRYFAGKGYPDIEGDGPSYGDHSFSFLHEGNHELFRAFFRGEI